MARTLCLLPFVLVALTACGDDEPAALGSGGSGGTGAASGGTGGASGGAGGASGSAGSSGAAGAPGALTLALPQAVDGALLGNQEVYAELPLRVATTGKPDSVEVDLGGNVVPAADPDGDGTFVAKLPVASLGDGTLKLTARAKRAGASDVTLDAELVLSSTGVQLTDWAKVGLSATPRLHRVGEQLWLTWRDRAQSTAGVWLRRLDGAARFEGDAVTLLDPSVDALYARAVFGAKGIGILYQTLGNPYVNHFTVVDPTGKELVAPIDLDPSGFYGNYGGDIAYDNGAWVFAWRDTDGTTQSVRWARLEEASGTLTGPSVVATNGNDDPNGSFVGFMPLGVRAIAGKTLIGFVRERWDTALQMAIPKSQMATVADSGAVLSTEYAGVESDFTFHHEARLFRVGDTLAAIWSANDLTSSDPNPPNIFFAAKTDASGVLDPNRGAGAKLVDAPDDREEPFLLAHPDRYGSLAWLDHRSYSVSLATGHIELYTAPVDADLSEGTETLFGHARFIAGTSELNLAPLGSNAMMVWLDERHGGGVLDPRSEVWVDTVWY